MRSGIAIFVFLGLVTIIVFGLPTTVVAQQKVILGDGIECEQKSGAVWNCCKKVTLGIITQTQCQDCTENVHTGEVQCGEDWHSADAGRGTSFEAGNSNEENQANVKKDLPLATDKILKGTIKCSTLPPKTPCYGTNNIDNIEGTTTDDFILGLDGADTISGLGSVGGDTGYDAIDGGDGADTVYGGPNFDNIYGGNGNDKIYGKEGNDGLLGWQGDDHIDGSDGNDRIAGGKGKDTLNGGNGDDKIYHDSSEGSMFFDFSSSDGSMDVIDCGTGQDEVWLNTGSDGDTAINCEKIHAAHPKLNSDAGNLKDNLAKK